MPIWRKLQRKPTIRISELRMGMGGRMSPHLLSLTCHSSSEIQTLVITWIFLFSARLRSVTNGTLPHTTAPW
jgi:hypothetical protein